MRIYLIFIAVFFILINAHISTAEENVDTYIKNAREMLANKNYPLAIETLMKVISITKDKKTIAKVSNAIGWAYYSNGNNKLAKDYLKKARDISMSIGADNITLRAINNLGLLEFSLENYAGAKRIFNNNLVINTKTSKEYLPLIEEQENKTESNKHVSIGIVYRLNKHFDKAIVEYDKALEFTPNNATILDYKGYALFRMKKYNESLEVLNLAYSIDKNHIYIPLNILKSYCGSGDYSAAISFIEKNADIIKGKKEISHDGEFLKVCNKKVASKLSM